MRSNQVLSTSYLLTLEEPSKLPKPVLDELLGSDNEKIIRLHRPKQTQLAIDYYYYSITSTQTNTTNNRLLLSPGPSIVQLLKHKTLVTNIC